MPLAAAQPVEAVGPPLEQEPINVLAAWIVVGVAWLDKMASSRLGLWPARLAEAGGGGGHSCNFTPRQAPTARHWPRNIVPLTLRWGH